MSFRTRLTTFFVLIVVIPMAAMGFLVFSLINTGQSGNAAARASGAASAAGNVYADASLQASLRARSLAQSLAFVPVADLPARAGVLAGQEGLARVTVTVSGRVVADVGSSEAVAPGTAVVTASSGHPARSFQVSDLTASRFAREISGQGVSAVIRSGSRVLASTAPAGAVALGTSRQSVIIGGRRYWLAAERLRSFGGERLQVLMLSSAAPPAAASVTSDRVLAIAIVVGFLVLAFFFSVLASRALGSQLDRFLAAARRLASGDFSSPITTSGRDEFALLGDEFNNMSQELKRRLDELKQERSRVRVAVGRIGEAFAAGLDREALLELALETAMDATSADRGRVSARHTAEEPLSETHHVGRLAELGIVIYESERRALTEGGLGQAAAGDTHVATAALGPITPGGPTNGLITVCRPERSFTHDDLELLRSLAAQTTLAMANVKLHYDVQRQAITDDLTGLATHGHFQDLLGAEMDAVRRYEYPVALIMLDIDDFKSVNDAHGHQQGDRVLQRVGDILRQMSRDVDVAARYGGEEMALILPHTGVEGAYGVAERIRVAIAAEEIPLIAGGGVIQVTTSAGVAASTEGNKNELIAAADGALYVAKREGKNRTVKAAAHPVNLIGGE